MPFNFTIAVLDSGFTSSFVRLPIGDSPKERDTWALGTTIFHFIVLVPHVRALVRPSSPYHIQTSILS